MTPAIAVFGCGRWGQNLVRNFFQLGALRLVCDLAESGRARARQIAPGIEVCDSFESALSRSDLDAVVLATPAATHHPLALKALAAGKDVYVEKPLALNLQQGREMQASAKVNDRILMVGHLLEYHPAILKLRELLAAKVLGKVHYIYSHRINFGTVRIEENALWSFAPHDIAVILRLFEAMPIEVTCIGGSYVTPNLADITISGLHFEGGQRAHIFVSWLNPFKEQKLVIVGDTKSAVFNDTVKTNKLVLYNQRVELNNREPILQKGAEEPVELAEEEPLRNECRHFLRCIEKREAPLTDAQNGVNVLTVLEACQRSLQLNGRPVFLPEL